MALKVKVTGPAKEAGSFVAKGVVTAPDGTEKGKATVVVRPVGEGGQAELVVSETTKSVICGATPSSYISGHVTEEPVELAKDAELVFKRVLFAI